MRRPRQLSFAGLKVDTDRSFGGAMLGKSHAKTKRAIVTKTPMHLVLRSSIAKGERSFLFQARRVEEIVRRQAKRFGVRLYDMANAGNHLHLLVLATNRRAFPGFLRALAGVLARIVMGVERGRAKGVKFWDARPYTRVLTWGREYNGVKKYLLINRTEMLGMSRLSVRAMLDAIKAFQRQPGLVAIGFDNDTA